MFLCVMHIDKIPNRNSPPTYLLRDSVRDGDRVRKVKIANLTALPLDQIEMIRRVLKGERLAPIQAGLDCIRSQHHGHVEAVRTAMKRLGFDKLIDTKSCRERDLVVGMIAGRIIAPEASKLGIRRGPTRRLQMISVLPVRTRTSSMRQWTGCLRVRTRSRNDLPSAT